eukprot:COSAG02_NODE_1302_length_13358_cov_12.308243_11_plen_80_part_00
MRGQGGEETTGLLTIASKDLIDDCGEETTAGHGDQDRLRAHAVLKSRYIGGAQLLRQTTGDYQDTTRRLQETDAGTRGL